MVMRIPADARFIRPVRLAVGGLASMLDVTVETIDDLRIAVDELCSALLETGDGSALELEISSFGRSLRIDGTTGAGVGEIDEDRIRFSRQILSVIADSFGYEVDDGVVRCWIERGLDDGLDDLDGEIDLPPDEAP